MKTKRLVILTLPIIAIALAMAASGTPLSQTRTTRKRLKVDPALTATEVLQQIIPDTLRGAEVAAIRLSGFDKPLRSNYETVFATNGTQHTIRQLVIECNYTDASSRQLHCRNIRIDCDIPPGQTRQLRFKSWDTQQAFQYKLSSKPRRASGTPFSVKCTVLEAVTEPTSHND